MVDTGELELIKIRYNYLRHNLGVLGSKPWELSALGDGMPYNRKKMKVKFVGAESLDS